MMNYSDYDSDGYSSNEDADYVPSDDNLSEDDINECEKEEPLHEGDGVPQPENTGKKKKKKDSGARKRAKGVLKLDEDEAGGAVVAQEEEEQEEVEKTTKEGKKDEEGEKKKSDDLWAKFLSGVETKPNDSATPKVLSSASKVAPSTTEQQKTAPQPAKVTITKILDFAGEEVRVTKEVSADSREAKNYLKSQSTTEEPDEDDQKSSLPSKAAPAGPSAKRPSGMSSIMNRLGGKKPKMSTLEKSKLDWDAYKSEEGITEELAIHNRGKEGYVERKNFLERVDHRQFEHEKAVRLSNMKQ